MGRAPLDGVHEEIKRHLSVADICREYGVPVGADGKMRCPEHPDERTPSCHVYRDHWHAFDCGKGGDIFDLVEHVTGRESGDVLRELAARAGVQLPRLTPEQEAQQKRRYDVLALIALLAGNFASRLEAQQTNGARAAAAWLQSRGIALRTAIGCRLGATEGWGDSLELIRKHGGQPAVGLAVRAGILRLRKSGKGVYDQLHDTVVFPAWRAGRLVGLFGRAKSVLGPEDDQREGKTVKLATGEDCPDALPSPALWWPRGRRDGRQAIYIVEGEIDALTMEQAGFQSVALLGTAGAGDADCAREIAGDDREGERIYIIPDDDGAGREAARKLASGIGVRLYVAVHPEWKGRKWKDPNDAQKAYLAEAMAEGLQGDAAIEAATARVRADIETATELAIPWTVWESRRIVSDYGDSPTDVAQLVSERVVPVLAGIAGRAVRDAAVAEVAEATGVKATSLRAEIKSAGLRVIRGGKKDAEGGKGGGDADDGRHPLVLPHELEAASQVVLGWMASLPRDEGAIYQRGRELVRVLPSHADDEDWLGVQLDPLTPESLRAYVHARARVQLRRGDEIVDDNMPLPLAVNILAKSDWGDLPRIRQVYRCPVLDTAGRVIAESGYCESLQAWVDIGRLQVPAVSDAPTDEELVRARGLVWELLRDFPFSGQADLANAIGLGILPFVRPLIQDVAAPHFVTAPTEGIGKSLIARCISQIATGTDPASLTQCKDDDEWEKRLGASLRKAPAVLLVDNIGQKQRLDSGVLASWMTSRHPEFRELGRSLMVRVRNDATWIFTGNNPATTPELARRFIWIRLIPDEERPSDRKGFRHSLPSWALENRSDLCWAFLTMAKRWVAGGMAAAPNGVAMGSYGEHVRVVGGILAACGVQGFCTNRDDHYRAAASDVDEWRALLQRWWDQDGRSPVGAKRAVELAIAECVLDGVLGDGNDRSQRTRMGNALSKRVQRVMRLWPGEGRQLDVRLVRDINSSRKTQDYMLTVVVREGYDASLPLGDSTPFSAPPALDPGGTEARGTLRDLAGPCGTLEKHEEPRPSQGSRDLAGPAGPSPATHDHTFFSSHARTTYAEEKKSKDPLMTTDERSRKVPQGPASPDGAYIVDAGPCENDPGEGHARSREVPQSHDPRAGYTRDPDEEEWS